MLILDPTRNAIAESLVYVMWFSMWPSRSKLTGFGAYCGSSSGFMNPGLTLSSCILRMASEADSRCYVRISGVTAAVLPFMGFDQHERLPATENVDWNRLNHKTTKNGWTCNLWIRFWQFAGARMLPAMYWRLPGIQRDVCGKALVSSHENDLQNSGFSTSTFFCRLAK